MNNLVLLGFISRIPSSNVYLITEHIKKKKSKKSFVYVLKIYKAHNIIKMKNTATKTQKKKTIPNFFEVDTENVEKRGIQLKWL